MSVGIKTKHFISNIRRSFWLLTFTSLLVITALEHEARDRQQTAAVHTCLAEASSLPINHSSHPCQNVLTQRKNWWSWLTNTNKSPHRHFLEFVELIHYSFD